jgi:hypothetical protein
VHLLNKGNAPERALRLTHRVLGGDDLPVGARDELEEVAAELRLRTTMLRTGVGLVASSVEVSLSGSGVRVGIADAGAVIDAIDVATKLGTRVFEYLTNTPLRRRGAPSPELRKRFQLLVSQPTAGSFRFNLLFGASAEQLSLDYPTQVHVDPHRQAEMFTSIIEAAVDPIPNRMDEIVSSAEYRTAFLQLVRELIPRRRGLDRCTVRRLGAGDEGQVTLVPTQRSVILRRLSQAAGATGKVEETVGVLRALDLNHNWIELTAKDRPEIERYYSEGAVILEDVLQPLVNQDVVVRWTSRQPMRRTLLDIASATA